MQIWMDGDACPKPIKSILFRAAIRTQRQLMIVSNHPFSTPPSRFIKKIQVEQGFDKADDYIINQVQNHDVVITADIPLAFEVVNKGAFALNPRGQLYTLNNIQQFLSQRNQNELLRSANLIQTGPAPLKAKDIQLFANQLDTLLAKHHLK